MTNGWRWGLGGVLVVLVDDDDLSEGLPFFLGEVEKD